MRAKTKTSQIPETTRLDGRTHSEPLEKAEAFNFYFRLVLKQPAHTSTSDDYDLLNRCSFSCSLIPDITISPEQVATILGSLDSKKACGPDGITWKLLKECAEKNLCSLSVIFNKSLCIGILPYK